MIRILILLVLGLSATGAAAAFADQPETLNPIVVTAQKFSQEETDTPISMDIFTKTDLEDQNIYNLKGLSLYTSNVHVKADNVGNSTIIRGIAPFTATLTGPAGIFVDGVALPTVFMQNPGFLNLERVEVLKGPQGALYGSNTESGVINFITADPDNRFHGKATAESYFYDTDDTPWGIRAGASVSSPVIRDKLFMSIAAAVDRTDGYFENIHNGDDRAGEFDRKDFHMKLRSTPTSRLELNLSSMYMDADDAKGKFRYSQGPWATEQYKIKYDGPYEQKYDGAINSLNARYDLENGLSLRSITGYTIYNREFTKDFDGSTANRGISIFDLDDGALSEELRLQAKDGRWLAGLFLSSRKTDVVFEKTNVNQRRKTDLTTTTYSLFGQYSLPVTSNNSVDLGVRVERTEVEADMDYTTSMGLSSFSDDETFDELLPKITWNHYLSDGIVYLSLSRGYLAGGASYNLATSKKTLLYGSEQTLNYEAGVKTTLGDGKYRISGALFYVDMDDKQITQSVPSEMGAFKIDNAAGAHTYGAELDAKARIYPGLDLFFNGGLTRSEVDDWSGSTYNSATGAYQDFDYRGNKLPYVPQYTASAGFYYLHHTGLFTRGDITATGDFYHDGANTLKEDALETVNMSLGYLVDSFTLTLWCQNCFDRKSTESATYWGVYPVVEDAAPRTIGIKLNYRF